MDFIRDIRRRADEVAFEADKALRVQRKQGEVNQLQRQIQHKLSELGAAAYAWHQDGQELPSTLLPLAQGIDTLYADSRARQNEIEAIRREVLPAIPTVGDQRCASCERPLPDGAAFCQHCGTRVPPPQPMIPCPHCGISLPADARFCANCGKAVASPPAQTTPAPAQDAIVCASCGAEIAGSAAFCDVCGAALGQASAADQPVAEMPPSVHGPDAAEAGQQPGEAGATKAASAPEGREGVVAETTYCPICASEVPAYAPFCVVCGAAMAQDA